MNRIITAANRAKMKKLILILLTLCLTLSLSVGCTETEYEKDFYLNSLRGLFGDEREICGEVMQYIVDAINERDADAMRILFSKKAQEESPTLDEDIEKLFDTLEGEYESHLFTHWQSETNSEPGAENRGEVKCIYFEYELQTSEELYLFSIGLCASDRTRKRNEGIYGLYVAEADDDSENANYEPWIPGINFIYRSSNNGLEDKFEW